MAVNNPYLTYQQSAMNTASPGDLTLMLYNGCLKFMKQAKQDIQSKNMEAKNTNIIKAQNIIRELMVTLNMDLEISHQLMPIYDFLLHRLIDANLNNDVEIIAEVEGFITEFRDTWKEVIKLNRQQQHGQGN